AGPDGNGGHLPARRTAGEGGSDRVGGADDGVPGRQCGGRGADPETARRQAILRSWKMDYPRGVDMAAAVAAGFVMDRRDAVPALIGRHEAFLFVTGLAGTARDIAALTN